MARAESRKDDESLINSDSPPKKIRLKTFLDQGLVVLPMAISTQRGTRPSESGRFMPLEEV